MDPRREVEPRWKQPKPEKKRRGQIAYFSAKRQEERAERAALVEFVHARDRVCRLAAVPLEASALLRLGVCAGPLDVHEVIPRSAWAKGYLDEDNCVLVCRLHHQWIDGHPDEAHKLGLHGYSYERPR